MPVYQISRIQVRRGKADSGTGFPQLASGELGWAFDTQELYIGNGSVAEGAPSVGNTRLLTTKDLTDFNSRTNIFSALTYLYKAQDPNIVTGPSSQLPIIRLLQDRLDDRINVYDFGATGDMITDDTAALQRAIKQLYLNPLTDKAYESSGVAKRVILEIPAGTYITTDTLYIPSYATIVGAGIDKTIIQHTGNGPAIQFINDNPNLAIAADITKTLGTTQPRNITLRNLTIETSVNGADQGSWNALSNYMVGDIVSYTALDGTVTRYIALQNNSNQDPSLQPSYWDSVKQIGMQIDAVKNSTFEQIGITGSWNNIVDDNNHAIFMQVLSDLITCENNKFEGIKISGFNQAVFAKQDVINNTFDNCTATNVRRGVVLGKGATGTALGELYGPRNTSIVNFKFNDVKAHAVYIVRGTGNAVEQCELVNVGNNGGTHIDIQYPQIYIAVDGNIVRDISSDRSMVLGNPSVNLDSVSLVLSGPVTASKGSYVEQAITGASGFLTTDVTSDLTIVLYGLYGTFDTTNAISIGGDPAPGDGGIQVTPSSVGDVLQHTYLPYIPEVSGRVSYNSFGTRQLIFNSTTENVTAFRLPYPTDQDGNITGGISYEIDYIYRSTLFQFIRSGTLYISADTRNGNVEITDEYDFVGPAYDGPDALKLVFYTSLRNSLGDPFLTNQSPSALIVEYLNTFTNDNDAIFTYSYKSIM